MPLNLSDPCLPVLTLRKVEQLKKLTLLLTDMPISTGYRADVTYEGEARVVSYQPQAAASSYKPVQVPAPRSYTPVVATEAPYQQSAPVVISNPAPATYRDSEPAQSAPVETFEPVAQSAPVESSNAPAGEVISFHVFF